ncbi:MAG: hypothetical protein AB1489_33660, partial [Acidobacteriota bacterium]
LLYFIILATAEIVSKYPYKLATGYIVSGLANFSLILEGLFRLCYFVATDKDIVFGEEPIAIGI